MVFSLESKKGFTLVEVLISIAIIGIIVGSFIGLFTTGFVNIFSTGHKDSAMAEASSYMDSLYMELYNQNGENIPEGLTYDEIKTLLQEEGLFYGSPNSNLIDEKGFFIISEVEPFEEQNGTIIRPGHKVTITVFYQDREREISLTSFIRGREDND